ncbi:MAG: ABC transporter permease [Gemmatimonadetes bacterium]|nr:ABC transporter permease [Gemmatimonadota bacterium]
MRRLLAAARGDVRLQTRNGFYYATLFVIVTWMLLVGFLPIPDLGWILPALVAGNLVITTFYFIAALVLLEKDENTLEALVVTPLRPGEYLAAKLATLTALAWIENLLIVVLLYGPRFDALLLSLGMVLASLLLTLAGFVAVARYDSINEFLMPSALYSTLLTLPLFPYLAAWEHALLYLHPMQAPLVLMRAAFLPEPLWKVLYGIVYSALWIAVAYRWAERSFHRFVIARAGAR